MHLDEDSARDSVSLLLHMLPIHAQWRCVEELRKVGAIRTLLFIVGESSEWSMNNANAKAEMVRNALEVLWICSVMPRVQLDLCDQIKVHNGVSCEGIG
jgi:hypothetical protein